MTYNEFQKRDMVLKAQIADYRRNSCDAQATIAMNEKEIINLEMERTKLHDEYARSVNDKVMKPEIVRCAHCGAYINKEDAILNCDSKNSRPVWLCANCDYTWTLSKTNSL